MNSTWRVGQFDMSRWRGYDVDMSQQDDSDSSSYTIDDLAGETGFDRRVIRSFIEQGLLRGPDSMGRYARYSKTHLDRLLAIKALKNVQGMPINEVRRALLSMSHNDIQALAVSSMGDNIIYPPPPTVSKADDAPESAASALDYIRSIEQQSEKKQANAGSSWEVQNRLAQARLKIDQMKQNINLQPPVPRPPQQQIVPSAEPQVTPLERLLLNLTALAGTTKPRRQAKGETWHRIPVTPDIELSVRGNMTEDELQTLERIADCVREILMGG
jgi:DNA-binding transcriptional MerR regulator